MGPFGRVNDDKAVQYNAAIARFEKPFAPKRDRIRVVDGDTIAYKDSTFRSTGDEQFIRLYGIDAAEDFGACQPIGEKAKAILQAQVSGAKSLLFQHALDAQGRHVHDLYGRQIAKVLVEHQDVGNIEIAAGVAHPYFGNGKRPPWNCTPP